MKLPSHRWTFLLTKLITLSLQKEDAMGINSASQAHLLANSAAAAMWCKSHFCEHLPFTWLLQVMPNHEPQEPRTGFSKPKSSWWFMAHGSWGLTTNQHDQPFPQFVPIPGKKMSQIKLRDKKTKKTGSNPRRSDLKYIKCHLFKT